MNVHHADIFPGISGIWWRYHHCHVMTTSPYSLKKVILK